MITITEPTDPENVYKVDEKNELHGTDFRRALFVKDYKKIESFLPDEINKKENLRKQVFAIFGIPPEPEIEIEPEEESESEEISETKKKGVLSSILYGLIEEVLDEHTEKIQKAWAKNHPSQKKRLIGKGGNRHTGGGKGHTNPAMTRNLSAPALEETDEYWAGFGDEERRLSVEELEKWGKENMRIWKEAEQKAGLKILQKLMREFDDEKFKKELKSYNLTRPENQNIEQGRNAFTWLTKYGIPTGYSHMTGEKIGSEENRIATLAWIEAGIKSDEAKKAARAGTRHVRKLKKD